MVLLADALATWLAAQCELGLGEDLFVGLLSESAALATALRQTGGPARGWSPVEPVSFQVLTRGPTLPAAFDRADLLYGAIYPEGEGRRAVRNLDLEGGWRLLTIDAIQAPTDLGPSPGGGQNVVFNLSVLAVRITNE